MINKKHTIDSIFSYFIAKGWIYTTLVALLVVYYKLIVKYNVALLIGFALLPYILLGVYYIIKSDSKAINIIIISQFLVLIINNIQNIPIGIVNLVFSSFILFTLLLDQIYKHINFKKALTPMLYLLIVWSLFCTLEILNPNNVQEAWNIYIMQYAFYPLLCAVLVPVTIKYIKDIKTILYIWSFFVILAVIKGYWQEHYGFNSQEMFFLYVLGGAKTHIIWSGIRYFSFFTDATNYGIHMAMAVTCFTIVLLDTKKTYERVYFFIVVCLATYGMMTSGTRAAIAVPLAGFLSYVITSANLKKIVITSSLLAGIIIFFMFTSIGSSNGYVYRMRTAFKPSQDASYLVRESNREKMKEIMINKPFGFGLGLGGKAERFNPKETNPYPPDSWLVTVWTDTGIVGISLYLLIHVFLFISCYRIILFKIKNKQLKGLLSAWMAMNVGFGLVLYTSDVMQYPNSIIVYTGFALCFAGVHIDKSLAKAEAGEENQEEKSDTV